MRLEIVTDLIQEVTRLDRLVEDLDLEYSNYLQDSSGVELEVVNSGITTKVDECFVDELRKYTLFLMDDEYVVICNLGISLHRWIGQKLHTPPSLYIDHKFRVKTDNRAKYLRGVTPQVNTLNSVRVRYPYIAVEDDLLLVTLPECDLWTGVRYLSLELALYYRTLALKEFIQGDREYAQRILWFGSLCLERRIIPPNLKDFDIEQLKKFKSLKRIELRYSKREDYFYLERSLGFRGTWIDFGKFSTREEGVVTLEKIRAHIQANIDTLRCSTVEEILDSFLYRDRFNITSMRNKFSIREKKEDNIPVFLVHCTSLTIAQQIVKELMMSQREDLTSKEISYLYRILYDKNKIVTHQGRKRPLLSLEEKEYSFGNYETEELAEKILREAARCRLESRESLVQFQEKARVFSRLIVGGYTDTATEAPGYCGSKVFGEVYLHFGTYPTREGAQKSVDNFLSIVRELDFKDWDFSKEGVYRLGQLAKQKTYRELHESQA